jgi:crotonobetainyl-CoA:carnitine CoA-transferase CaiB-like acyl-CoA transferase
LAAEGALAGVGGRLGRRGEIEAAVGAWTAQRSPHEAMYALQAAGVPAGAVQNSRDLIEDDPQIKARGLFDYRLDHPEMGMQQFEGIPVRLSRTPGSLRASTPLLSEHNRYVLGDLLGMSEDEIARLEEAGIV